MAARASRITGYEEMNQHLIDEVIFDITFDSMSNPHARESALRAFIVDALLPVVDDVFSQYSAADLVWQIDTLDIDIGDVSEQNFQAEMIAQLTSTLVQALHEKIAPLQRDATVDGVRAISSHQADTDLLFNYLIDGSLPWQANMHEDAAHELLLQRVLQTDVDDLFAFLRVSPMRMAMLSRLTQQFPEMQLLAILQKLVPAHFDRLRNVLDDFRQVFAKMNGGNATQQHAMHLAWAMILDEGLDASDAHLSAATLMRRIVTELALHRQENYASTLSMVKHAAWQVQGEKIRDSEIPADIQMSNLDYGQHVARPDVHASTADAGNSLTDLGMQRIQNRVAQSILSGDAENIYQDWEEWLRQYPSLLRDAIAHYGVHAGTAERIANGFPPSLLLDMMALLAPRAAILMDRIWNDMELFGIGSEATRYGGWGQWKRRQWIAGIRYLLSDEWSISIGATFNDSAYLDAIPATAGNEKSQRRLEETLDFGVDTVRHENFATPLLAATPSDPARTNGLNEELAGLLQDAEQHTEPPAWMNRYASLERNDANALENSTAAARTSGPNSVIPIDEHAERTALPLSQDGVFTEKKKQELLLLQKIRHGELSLTKMDFTVGELEAMLAIAVGMADEAGLRTAGAHLSFLESIVRHAAVAGDRHRYYAEVLRALADQRIVDLEAIAQASHSEGGDENAVASDIVSSPGNTGDPVSALDEDNFKVRLAQALLRGDASDIYAHWNSLLLQNPSLLRDALHHYGIHEEVAERIASGFPESLLHDMIALLAPAAADVMQELWNKPGWHEATNQVSPHTGREQWKKSLWKTALLYLLSSGQLEQEAGTFDRHAYICALFPTPAGIKDIAREQFIAALEQALEQKDGAEKAHVKTSADENDLQAGLASRADAAAGVATAADASARIASLLRSRQTLADGSIPLSMVFDDAAGMQLRQLFTELRNARHNFTAAGWSALEMGMFVCAYINLDERPTIENRDAFMQAIASHATLAADRHRYFSQIFEALLNDRMIDLEAIAASSTAISGEPCAEKTRVAEQVVPAAEEPDDDSIAHENMQRLLRMGLAAGQEGGPELAIWLKRTLSNNPASLRVVLSTLLRNAGAVSRLLDLLPQYCWPNLLAAIAHPQTAQAARYANDISDAFASLHYQFSAERIVRLKWQFLLAWLSASEPGFNAQHFARAFLDALVQQTGLPITPHLEQLLRRRIGLSIAPETRRAPPHQAARELFSVSKPASSASSETAVAGSYVINAGLVLAAPYLPRLWTALGLSEHGAFTNHQAAERAVHLLQFMVNEQTSYPEYRLGLNKIMCGIGAETTIVRDIHVEENEIVMIEELMQAMISHWKGIGNTSIQGLRTSFLQRSGWLRLKDDAWYLDIQLGPFDMLLDQLPWSFSIIKYPWMERAVHVKWR